MSTQIFEMFGLTAAQVSILEARMRPGQFSDAGFLGQNESLVKVLLADRATLDRYGITHTEVATLLDQVISGRTDHYQVEVGDRHFRVDVWERPGHQSCPYGAYVPKEGEFGGLVYRHDGPLDYGVDLYDRGSRVYTVTDIETGDVMRFGGLLVHLIREHQLCEGEGTSFRLPPERAIVFLGMNRGNRSARVVEDPQYLYEGYGPPVFNAVLQVICSGSGLDRARYALDNLNKAIDGLSFVSARQREDWKRRAAEIIGDDLGEHKSPKRLGKMTDLADLAADIEMVVIMSAGYVPQRYRFVKTTTLGMEVFRVAKVLGSIAKQVDMEAKNDAPLYFGRRYTLLDWILSAIGPRSCSFPNNFPVTKEQLEPIRRTITEISDVMERYQSYSEAKERLDPLLKELNRIVAREFASARDTFLAELRGLGIKKDFV